MSSTHAGKVAIVTGSARSIGAAIASQLASELGKVVLNYNIGEAAAEDVVAAILRDGGKALALQADVSTSGKKRGRSAEDGQNGCPLQAGNAC